jgi:hypothetical protein
MYEYEVCELLECGDCIIEGMFSSLEEAENLRDKLELEGKKITIFVIEDIEVIEVIER